MLDVIQVACQDGIAVFDDERDSGISNVARAGTGQQKATITSCARAERSLDKARECTSEPGLACGIPPRLGNAG